MSDLLYRVLFIDVSSKKHRLEEYRVSEISGPVELGVKLHIEKFESWRKPVYHPDNALVLGTGLFAGSRLYGAHRFIAVFKSPLTRGLHVSAMGGAAFQFNVNAHALVIEGRAEQPQVIKVYGEADGSVSVEFHAMRFEDLLEIWKNYKGMKGVYGLQQYLVDRFGEFFEKYTSRCILVGPGSLYTNTGALVSLTLLKGRIDFGSEDFAARAGGGSVLMRAHNVAAIVYGGMYNRATKLPQELVDMSKLNEIFQASFGKPYSQVVIEQGTKYRYDPKANTGGTLGGNYPHLGVTTPMLHWLTIHVDKPTRQMLHEMIMKHIWEPFNKEAIETKSWKTCGEPCPLACKKVRKGKYKSDYEPYNGLGPFIGIFDIHEAEKVVELADAYGIDAIELGYIIGFVFECVSRGLLKPEEVGISGVPVFDASKMSIEASKRNAQLAMELVEKLSWGVNPILKLIAERGLRDAAKVLDTLYSERVARTGTKFSDLLVYASFGESGHISPNYYWTPGLVAPLYVLGKYWTVYSGVFADPEEFASKCIERATYEIMVENAGFCRFHRGWAEKILPKLLELVGVREPLKRSLETYKLIAKYQRLAGATPQPWDSERILEFMATAAKEYANTKWSEMFEKSKQSTALEWWNRFSRKVEEILQL